MNRTILPLLLALSLSGIAVSNELDDNFVECMNESSHESMTRECNSTYIDGLWVNSNKQNKEVFKGQGKAALVGSERSNAIWKEYLEEYCSALSIDEISKQGCHMSLLAARIIGEWGAYDHVQARKKEKEESGEVDESVVDPDGELIYAFNGGKMFTTNKKNAWVGSYIWQDSKGVNHEIYFPQRQEGILGRLDISKSTPYNFSVHEKEAIEKGFDYYGNLLANCDGHFYRRDKYENKPIIQSKSASWKIISRELSEVDKLNNKQWIGEFEMILSTPTRRYTEKYGWSDWGTNRGSDDDLGKMLKRDGKWTFDTGRHGLRSEPIDCSMIP